MPFTLRYALERLARHNGAKGSCWDSPSNLERLNDVRRLIYERGEFSNTMEWCCVSGSCCFSLPGHLETVKWAYARCGYVFDVSDQFWAATDRNSAQACADKCGIRKLSIRQSAQMRPYVGSPTFPTKIAIVADSDDDVGKTISVFSGTEETQIVIEKARSHNVSKVTIRGISAITKPETIGDVHVYAHDGSTRVRIATYQMGDTAPMFSSYQMIGDRCRCASHNIIAYCKKRFVPMTIEQINAPVDIGSLTALQHGYAAMSFLDARNSAEYAGAVKLMEEQLEEHDQELSISEPVEQVRPPYTMLHGIALK